MGTIPFSIKLFTIFSLLQRHCSKHYSRYLSAIVLESLTIQKVYLKEIKLEGERRELSLPTKFRGSLGLHVDVFILIGIFSVLAVRVGKTFLHEF